MRWPAEHSWGSIALYGRLELRLWNIGDADGSLNLAFGQPSILGSLPLRNRDAGVPVFRWSPTFWTCLKRLQQLPTSPHRPCLDAVSHLAERVVVSLPCIGCQRLGNGRQLVLLGRVLDTAATRLRSISPILAPRSSGRASLRHSQRRGIGKRDPYNSQLR